MKIGLMGRIAVSFGVSTLLPIFLIFLSSLGVLSLSSGILILVLAGLLFILWIYMGIVKPVDELKRAAKRIESKGRQGGDGG